MNIRTEIMRKLPSECLLEHTNSYPIDDLLEQFPTIQELMNVSEQQLVNIKGIGLNKTCQLSAILKLAKC